MTSLSVAPVISFHDYALFDVYRQELELVSHIGVRAHQRQEKEEEKKKAKPLSPIKKKQSSSMDVDQDVMDMAIEMEEEFMSFDKKNWDIDPIIEEKQERHISLLEQQQKEQQQLQCKQDLFSKEYALIQQMEANDGKDCLYDYTTEDIIEGAAAHCAWLMNDICVDKMNNTNSLLRKNLEFELLCQDKKSVKIVSLHDRFIELALREDSDKKEFDSLIKQTHEVARDPPNDKFFLKSSEQRKRGRTSDADRLKTLNIVDTLRKEYITPKKVSNNNNEQASSEIVLTDKYRSFLFLLKLVHDNAQTGENYGAYLEKTNRLIEYVEREKIDWPMLKLMKSIVNMETCIGINEIESISLDEDEIYYCSYSGDQLKQGDDVYHIRILEYSHERHKKWRIIKNRPNREFESPEFMASVKAYFVKKHFISLTGLWYRDFDDDYKSLHTETTPKTPVKRQRHSLKQEVSRVTIKKDGHLWRRMDYMRNYINQHNLEHKLVHGKTFSDETQRIHALMDEITDNHTLQVNLCEIIGAYHRKDDQEDNKMARVNTLMYILLDFIDVFYSVSSCEDDTNRPLTTFDIGSSCALRLILDVSHLRRNHPSFNVRENEFEKIDREEKDVNQYVEFSENNFLFLCLFDYLFPSVIVKKEDDAIGVLHMFGL